NYKGKLINNRTIGQNEGERPKHDWIVVENAHPSIIDEETWKEANKIVNTYKFSKPRAKNRIYPTSKLIFCGNCGTTQTAQKATSNGKLYIKNCRHCHSRCYQYLPVLKMLKKEVKKYRQGILDAIQTIDFDTVTKDTTEHKRKQLEHQIRKANQALDNIEILFEESEI